MFSAFCEKKANALRGTFAFLFLYVAGGLLRNALRQQLDQIFDRVIRRIWIIEGNTQNFIFFSLLQYVSLQRFCDSFYDIVGQVIPTIITVDAAIAG